MKQYHNGFRYDTEKATKIGNVSNGVTMGDEGWRASIYQTLRNKKFFIAGRGGKFSLFADRFRFTRIAGECIIEMSEDEAKWWLKRYSQEG